MEIPSMATSVETWKCIKMDERPPEYAVLAKVTANVAMACKIVISHFFDREKFNAFRLSFGRKSTRYGESAVP
jgi:hypothetical protein